LHCCSSNPSIVLNCFVSADLLFVSSIPFNYCQIISHRLINTFWVWYWSCCALDFLVVTNSTFLGFHFIALAGSLLACLGSCSIVLACFLLLVGFHIWLDTLSPQWILVCDSLVGCSHRSIWHFWLVWWLFCCFCSLEGSIWLVVPWFIFCCPSCWLLWVPSLCHLVSLILGAGWPLFWTHFLALYWRTCFGTVSNLHLNTGLLQFIQLTQAPAKGSALWLPSGWRWAIKWLKGFMLAWQSSTLSTKMHTTKKTSPILVCLAGLVRHTNLK